MSEQSFERWHDFYPRWLAYARELGASLGLEVLPREDGGILVKGESAKQAELYRQLMEMLIGWGRLNSQGGPVG
jgi:hypothetical protein